mgnify:CR=1 FL=1
MMTDDFNTFVKRNLDVMKIKSVILSAFLICNGQIACADALDRTRNAAIQPETNKIATGFFQKITPEMLYGYTDFNFNSTTTGNFNRFKGHSNLYSAGADHISLGNSIMAGVYYFRIDTALASKFSFAPNPVANSDQTIKNNTIFGHVLKLFTPQIYVDVAGGYGYNQLNTYTTIEAGELNPDSLFAHARNNTDNWFVSVNGIYRKSWQKFLLRANLGVLYSQINTPHFYYMFPATNGSQRVDALTNKATLLLENAELGYFVNPKLMPFVNVGLIQVAHFSNSRPIVSPASIINGSLPQLNMNKDGFRLGAGVAYTYKNVSMRVEEKYYNASSTFKSYQTLVALEYQFS